jgi:hypothetical protein
MVSKLPSTRRLLAEVVLRDLAAEARYERALARFSGADDDTTYPPEADPVSSAQSRRSLPVEVH